ncbi:aminotransferase class V-fold PLP-dependent enzyme [Flagellimonas abyssi]|uniref:Aminotransferase class V-fold PLP-dependent enzyme n=1 Tax=Flagellimonas abyssi TaxID=2864871 RepID=A0ABS7EL85_9FLAO|nr:aminotransferase class V-fold PLP-dependent enzyme [Allomuricauda abyssi]MBW8198266.1 aminotransferase class V-fold PLP-dependent enzyme [Allomuricauda abyssi]
MLELLIKKIQGLSSQNVELLHDAYFNRLRAKNYERLDRDGHVYLDYTGGSLYASSQLNEHMELLASNTFGNPHSSNPTSELSTNLVEEARDAIISFFKAHDYYCVFTPNASGALKIVGECYPFENDGHFLLLADNHNSVNGIREYCKNAGGVNEYVPMNRIDLGVSRDKLFNSLKNSSRTSKLFAYPAQSNVSGIKHDLQWISTAQSYGWDVLLDAAAFAPTSPLDLTKHSPNFVAVSFYKMFGYPTGLGCLLIKKSSFGKLQKKWFAGGTVNLASAMTPHHFLMDNHERFEDGTLNYLDIPALKIGLDYLKSIGMKRLNERVGSLMEYIFYRLKDLTHSNGAPQLEIFGHPKRLNTGGTMSMCFKNPDGSKIDFHQIEEMANDRNISLRSGCFCNPGLDETINCMNTNEIDQYFKSRVSGNYLDMIDFLQVMRGSIRISVGIATNRDDLDAFVSLVRGLKDKTISKEILKAS